MGRLVLHVFIHFLRSEDLLVVSKSDAHSLSDCVCFFTLECQNVGQKGFNTLVRLDACLGACQAGLCLPGAPSSDDCDAASGNIKSLQPAILKTCVRAAEG